MGIYEIKLNIFKYKSCLKNKVNKVQAMNTRENPAIPHFFLFYLHFNFS